MVRVRVLAQQNQERALGFSWLSAIRTIEWQDFEGSWFDDGDEPRSQKKIIRENTVTQRTGQSRKQRKPGT